MRALATGMFVTVPVVGLAIYLTGGSISYIEPLLKFFRRRSTRRRR